MYTYQEYPKVLYAADGSTCVVQGPDEEMELPEGMWKDAPWVASPVEEEQPVKRGPGRPRKY